MHQTTMFDEPAIAVDHAAKKLARASHPSTSAKAAEELVESGKLAVMELVALGAVEDYPGSTARELDEGKQGDRPIGKRLSGLEEKGLIVKGPERVCRVSGKTAVTWNVVRRTTR